MHYLIWRDFLSASECETLINIGRSIGQMQRSSGFDVGSGQSTVSDYRTSQQVWLHRGRWPTIVDQIEQRISEATGVPVQNMEAFQLAWYPQGCEYKPHHDYFHEQYEGSQQVLARGGQRIITWMVYLNTLPEGAGGETEFMKMGLKVRPEAGKACVWWNVMPDWRVDDSTYHAGLPPKEGYEKFIITKWIRSQAIQC
jgi:prolyl 4-hydroxylase